MRDFKAFSVGMTTRSGARMTTLVVADSIEDAVATARASGDFEVISAGEANPSRVLVSDAIANARLKWED